MLKVREGPNCTLLYSNIRPICIKVVFDLLLIELDYIGTRNLQVGLINDQSSGETPENLTILGQFLEKIEHYLDTFDCIKTY